ncbi:hypothetical protein C2E20_1450 [Micractinium conductrix]|uniref:Uncharacterized protein n=1 Tax=Micractinium conductrix TaxID=554055 RepID=A0A2P6VNM3_9CHLO|nr:hypothetical protein C2E20_1450 [Micractinium conductrix]|eukprot:PSC75694.1 hypothetical protein C2E20_1450 [Micractinium conductrix]
MKFQFNFKAAPGSLEAMQAELRHSQPPNTFAAPEPKHILRNEVGRDKNDKPTRVRNDQPSRSGPWD